MSLIIGENCYTDIEQADDLIHKYFLSSSNIRKIWDELNNNDKEIVILSATINYDKDSMLYIGRKKYSDKTLQFPRYIHGKTVECPERIKLGILVCGIYDIMGNNYNMDEFEALKLSGVKSFADGSGARVEFGDKSSINNNYVKNSLGIRTELFNSYFKQYTMIT